MDALTAVKQLEDDVNRLNVPTFCLQSLDELKAEDGIVVVRTYGGKLWAQVYGPQGGLCQEIQAQLAARTMDGRLANFPFDLLAGTLSDAIEKFKEWLRNQELN